ncbi:unnamed protein product, partial [Owenia fusiformis]
CAYKFSNLENILKFSVSRYNNKFTMSQAADRLIITLKRTDTSVPWGFRLQGGQDFSTPLSVQNVSPNSVAERCGLMSGDAVLQINGRNCDTIEHEQAKMEIVRSGNEVVFMVERGAVYVWKPEVTKIEDLKPDELKKIEPLPGGIPMVQKTSLAVKKQDFSHIGSAHNRSARGFGAGGASYSTPSQQQSQPPPFVAAPQAPQGGYEEAVPAAQLADQGNGNGPAVVHAQFNSPMGLYSADNIADTYTAQTSLVRADMASLSLEENGKQKNYRSSPTAQLILQEEAPPTDSARYKEQDPAKDYVEYKGFQNPKVQSRSFRALEEALDRAESPNDSPAYQAPSGAAYQPQAQASPAAPMGGGFKSVSAPITKPPGERTQQSLMKCAGCGGLCVGVLVKIKGNPYHPECFKCAACSVNLKQKGYFVIDEKLYCDIHAKQRAQPPAPGMKAQAVYR